jgi:YD repeat-containing protein
MASCYYTYGTDASHPLQTVASSTGFPGERTNQFVEIRNYTSNGKQPSGMVRIKNGRDTLWVTFIAEEHGWIGEERWLQKGKLVETYYYYYDAAGRVTDITHFNKTARRILPDYTFEYNAQGRLTSMVTFINGTNQYRTWRYTYDSRGLKTGEVVYNKYRQQEGKLIYSYQ